MLFSLNCTFLLLCVSIPLGTSQALGNTGGIPVIEGREWSDGKLVISVVGSSEYLGIFIFVLRVLRLSVGNLKLGSLLSFSGSGVEMALGFLTTEGVVTW